jgi:hypothetical protein
MAGGNLIYDTNLLIAVVPNLKRPTSFLLDRYFPTIHVSDTEFVSIDIDIGKRRISPFVSPLIEGKTVEQRRFQTNTFKPAYLKDKRAPDLRRPIRRMIGERLGGDMSGAEREMANLNVELEDQIDMITRRLEWMAAQSMLNGTVTIRGEGYPSVVVDFGRDPALTVSKTSTAQWTPANCTAGTASPTTDIEAWQRLILKKSGAVATDIVFTTSAWLGFISDPLLKGVTFYPALGPAGQIVLPGPEITRGAVAKGRWGQYTLYLYNEWYVDIGQEGGTTDTEYPMLPDGTVLLAGPDMMGLRAFGQIIDPAFSYAGMAYAPKTWVSEDPPQRFLMVQSSPITILARPNASLAATVCSAVYN